MANPNDTTTTLNAGIGGDTMDETLVTQISTGTSAKRPRVVVGGDDGSLLSLGNDGTGMISASVEDSQALKYHMLMFRELRRLNIQIRVLIAALTASDSLTDEELDDMDLHTERE